MSPNRKPPVLKWDTRLNEPIWPKGFLWHIEFTREMQGYVIPRRYLGFSYYEFDRDVAHYYVIPINLIVAAARWCWFGLRYHWPRALRIPERWR